MAYVITEVKPNLTVETAVIPTYVTFQSVFIESVSVTDIKAADMENIRAH